MTVTLYQKHLDVTFTDANGKCEEFSAEKKNWESVFGVLKVECASE